MSALRGVLGLLMAPGIERLWRPWTRGAVPILMLHRFTDAREGGPGMPVDTLRRQLSELRRRRIRVMPLTRALDELRAGAPLKNAMVLTVDDGYADFHDLALPVFSEFDCAVTVFLVSGFLDHRTRLWWDTVRMALAQTGREVEASARIEALKQVSDDERLRAVADLCRESGIDPDEPATGRLAPMSWDMVRAAAGRGATFGPHTVSHPILSKTSDQRAEFEIAESWRRVRQETEAAIPVFCYPNGRAEDQGEREFAVLRRLGLEAGVTTVPGFASSDIVRSEGVFAVPRFAHPFDLPHLLQLAGGLERLKLSLRHRSP